jgi:hypothetical protein
MAHSILSNTPLWAWAILIVVVTLGLIAARTRRLSSMMVLLLPITMAGYSIAGVSAAFGPQSGTSLAWLSAAAAAFFANRLVRRPPPARYDAATNSFEVAGSWLPLALMLGIFAVNFAIGVVRGARPALLADPLLMYLASGALGAFTGVLLARAARILETRQREFGESSSHSHEGTSATRSAQKARWAPHVSSMPGRQT